MAKLNIYLTPFASDYSGAASVFYELGALVAMAEPSCCMKHYTNIDEPRWQEEVKPIMSTQMRTMDAIFGDERKTLDKIKTSIESRQSDLVAIIASPVPATIGMDTEGMAMELEIETGIPAIGIDTNGFDYYDKGTAKAQNKLIEKMIDEKIECEENYVNILGYNPMDYGNVGNDDFTIKYLEKLGKKINVFVSQEKSLDKYKDFLKAEENIAVSDAGLNSCKWLEEKYKMPFKIASPFQRDLIAYNKEENQVEKSSAKKTLILMDQLLANSLRAKLYEEGYGENILCATFFTFDESIAWDGDMKFSSERDLIKFLRENEISSIITDETLALIPEVKKMKHVKTPVPAISGRISWEKNYNYGSKDFSDMLDKLLEK